MSFLNALTHKQPYIIQNKKQGKEHYSLLANHFFHKRHILSERASVFTSKGSLTLEAAVVVPLFFFAMLSLICVLEMMTVKSTMRHALYSAGREISQQSYVIPLTTGVGLKQRIVKTVGKERIERSLIRGGVAGIDCSRTICYQGNAEYDLSVRYRMEVPILCFKLPMVTCEEELKVKGWTGLSTGTKTEEADTVVYVTKEGTVYHKDMFCTYLVMSVKTTTWEEIGSLRNQSGGRYYACESCGRSADNTGRLYITDYGDRYHVSIGCSTLKRVVYAVPYHEVSERGGCAKCVKSSNGQ